MGFPDSSIVKESACNAGDPGLIPGLGRSPGEGIDYPLQYFWASLVAQLLRICLQCGRPGFKPWVGKIPGEGKGYPLQYSGPENSMDCIVSPWGRKESDTTVQLSIISILARHGIWLLLTKKDTGLPWWFSW